MLLGCYRTGGANDPEVYIASIIRVLSAYPIDVAMKVADPLSGLPSTHKWLPQANEIREACEDIMGIRRRLAESELRRERQLAERDADEQRRAENPRPSYEELQRRCHEVGLYIGGKQNVALYDRKKGLDELKAKYGVTDEQLSHIPNLPERGL